MTDADLLARSVRGDEDAFRTLYDRHARSVFSFAWLLTKSIFDAEDITQECFLILIQKGSTFDARKAQLRTWLLGIARNVSLHRIHRNRAAANALGAEPPHAESDSAEQSMIRDEAAEAVRRAVAALPGSQREAVFLFEFEGLSLREVASILQINTNAVKARLHRAREQLKIALADFRAVANREGMSK